MASKERYLIFPGSNFALKQPTVEAEKKRKAGINRARKRFPGYFSKELPHASWEEVITDWWAKMSTRERGEVLAIRDPEVMQQIAFINNQLLCQGFLLQNGMIPKTNQEPKPLTQKKRRPHGKGAIFQSSSSESDNNYPLLDNFNNYFENAKNNEDTIIHCMEHFITINIKEEALLEIEYFPRIIEKASHKRFLRRKWVPRSEKEVWTSISPSSIQTWGDLQTALALLLENNLLRAYEPQAQKKMDQKLKCLAMQCQSEKECPQVSKAVRRSNSRRLRRKRERLSGNQIRRIRLNRHAKQSQRQTSLYNQWTFNKKPSQFNKFKIRSYRDGAKHLMTCRQNRLHNALRN